MHEILVALTMTDPFQIYHGAPKF